MNNNKIYLILIILLTGIIGFLIVLLFMGDSGKYCVPITKEKEYVPSTAIDKDSVSGKDSLSIEY